MSSLVVISTVGNEEQAKLIARELVARRQAACVNVIPGIKSFYRWQGEICEDGELLLVVKTLAAEYEAVAATIRELHSYEVPEILSFRIAGGDRPYLEWLAASVGKDGATEEQDQ